MPISLRTARSKSTCFDFSKPNSDHASCERVLSGPGLSNIYRFIRARSRIDEPAWLTRQIAAADPAAAISDAALAGRDPVCVHAMSMFCDIYGSEAANLALKVLALGGVFSGRRDRAENFADADAGRIHAGIFVEGTAE